ncbi:hypothetical protein PUV54_12015 [Hyphococcus flavus]|uniref:Uncharacterized protein n=1 Tax=Hyphococcus flavus TaxID=1866326 RepID=A0AAE9ZC36_9PROT|nr:hypothetical protein [Hyphococcus flavus]WDI30680.1 hypothetical protein PUV54_12015 [Hyphococcus flavus]
MRTILSTGFIFLISVLATASFAQGPSGYFEIYNEPTNVNLGGRWVVADIALYADTPKTNELSVALVTDVTKFIDETERDLENWVATNQERCGERWGAGEPQISFPENAIRFVLDLEYERWSCGLFGRGEPGRVGRTAGRIDITLDPYIEDGKLQARLADFRVEEREGVARYLPLETVARNVINSEIAKLDKNRKFYRAPNPFFTEGFEYQSIEAVKFEDDRVVITARYRAEGGLAKLDRLVEAIGDEGVTQER